MQDLLDCDELDFCFEMAIAEASSLLALSDCSRIVQSLAKYRTVVKVKARIDQVTEGLHTLGVYDLIKANPQTMHKLFTSCPKYLTADFMMSLFQAKCSPEGSNRREEEEEVLMHWVHFLELIEGKC